MQFRYLTVALLASFPFLASAQEQPKSTKTTSDGNTTIVITEHNASDYFTKKDRGDAPKTAIKLNPLLALNGDLPVFVERVLTEKLSVELGAGVTIKNYLGDLFDTIEDESSSSFSDVKTEPELGYSVSAGLRFYPSSHTWALEGVYFAPEFRHRLYKTNVLTIGDEQLDSPELLKTNITNFRAIIGNVYYLEDRVFLDYYAGAGLTNRNTGRVHTEREYNVITWGYDYTSSFYNEKKVRPSLALGLKIGFSF